MSATRRILRRDAAYFSWLRPAWLTRDFCRPSALEGARRANSRLVADMFSDTSTGCCCRCDGDREADHVGQHDRRRDQVLIGGGRLLRRPPLFASAVDERPFLTERAREALFRFSCGAARSGRRCACWCGLLALVFHPRDTGAVAWPDLPSPPPCGDRPVHHDAATVGRMPRQRLRGLAVDDQVVVLVATRRSWRAVDVHLRISSSAGGSSVETLAATSCTEAPALRPAGRRGRLQLDVVDDRADRMLRIAARCRLDRRSGRRDRVARATPWREDVAALAVGVQHQREVRAAVRSYSRRSTCPARRPRTHEVDHA